ncbi:MAG: homoserine kinase [Bacteroidia bacterium]|nr:homoserine kinase [Bacteroidia bacterium]
MGLKVFAPASVANMACGYDVLGFALNGPGDEIIIKKGGEKGLKITKITGAGGKLPYNVKSNTAGFAGLKLLEHLGLQDEPIALEIHKKMPFGSGLGSSAASAAGAVMAINEYLRRPLAKRDLLKFAVEGEQIADGAWHADNVAPALLGGIVLVRDNASLDVHKIPVPRGLFATVIHPKIEVLTKEARAILKKNISLKQCIAQTGNIAGLVVGLYNSDFDLIGRSLKDHIIEPQRASLIPNFYTVQEAAMKNGALGCSISGAGPSIFALSNNSLNAENIGNAMQRVFADNKVDSKLYISPINLEGTQLL